MCFTNIHVMFEDDCDLKRNTYTWLYSLRYVHVYSILCICASILDSHNDTQDYFRILNTTQKHQVFVALFCIEVPYIINSDNKQCPQKVHLEPCFSFRSGVQFQLSPFSVLWFASWGGLRAMNWIPFQRNEAGKRDPGVRLTCSSH